MKDAILLHFNNVYKQWNLKNYIRTYETLIFSINYGQLLSNRNIKLKVQSTITNYFKQSKSIKLS